MDGIIADVYCPSNAEWTGNSDSIAINKDGRAGINFKPLIKGIHKKGVYNIATNSTFLDFQVNAP